MNIVPFGDVEKDRFDLSKKYKLIEMTAGFWRLTKKCRDNYDPESYIRYLQGKLEQPIKIKKQKIINELLSL
ncbi:MAG TPA: hypothetical protein PKW94_02715 [Candidatus Dojkabacteria bacterium]|nr:hypothetical protein [Candidatus Dojkabacteria bacterium]